MSTSPDLPSIIDFARQVGDAASTAGEVAQVIPWARGAYRQMCRVWAGTGVPQGFELVGLPTICSPYLADDGRSFGQQGSPPFTGGQCPGVRYDVLWDTRINDAVASTDNDEDNVPGPISYVTGVGSGDRPFAQLRDGNGNFIGGASVQSGDTVSLENIRVSRRDGQPDDCGDPDSNFEPGDGYQGENYGDPSNYTDPNGDDWDIRVGPPIINDDGTISIPVTVNGNQVDVGVPGTGGGGGDGLPAGGDAVAGDPISGDGSEGDEDVPDGPPGTICVAVALSVQGLDLMFGGIPNTSPNLRTYAPFGNFSVRFTDNQDFTAYGRDITLYSQATVEGIPVEGLQVSGFRVQLVPGLTYVATPYYRRVQEENSDGG